MPSSQSIVHWFCWLQLLHQVAVTLIDVPIKNMFVDGITLVTIGVSVLIVTVWLQALELPAASVTVQFTVLLPRLNCVSDVTTLAPYFGVYTNEPDNVQLSVAVGLPNGTPSQPLNTALHTAKLTGKTILGAHAKIVGFCVSFIVTVN